MNKKMRELLQKIDNKRAAAKAFMELESPEIAKAKAELDSADALYTEYEIEKRLFEASKDQADPNIDPIEKKTDGFSLIAKILRKQRLTEAEKALVTGTNAADGENYLVPEDTQLVIRELRKSYISAKNIVNVIPTLSLSGSFNFEIGTPAGLVKFDDGDAFDETNKPSFSIKTFTIEMYGKLIPISNILKDTEKAGLMAYINRWFVKNAIISENSAIFTVLKSNKSPSILADWKALASSINKDLDPSALNDGALVTNQSGFDFLDTAVDATGRPILTTSGADSMTKIFKGLPIIVFSDAQLANVGGDAPVFYGSLKAGCDFIEKMGLEFAVSDQYLFNKNQTALRVIEGFDVMQTDVNAYVYNLLNI